jgi:hypothetical protein
LAIFNTCLRDFPLCALIVFLTWDNHLLRLPPSIGAVSGAVVAPVAAVSAIFI